MSRAANTPLDWLTFDTLVASLLFLAIGTVACFAPAQSDTWWLLRAGRDIWTSGSVDLHDHFSHTVGGGYWPNHEWLSQLLFYGVYSIGGLRLLTALLAALTLGTWLVIWRLTPGRSAFRLALCAAALIPSCLTWSLRPQVLSLFLLAATAFLVVRGRYVLLPPLFLVWANLHGGVVLGFVVLGGAILALLVKRERPTRLAIAAAVCFVATLLTPLGPSFWTEVPASLARLRAYRVIEWRPPTIWEPALLPFWLLAISLVWLAVGRQAWRSAPARTNALFWMALATLPLALGSGRNVPAFLLFAVPAIEVARRAGGASPSAALRGPGRPALNLCLLVIAGVLALTAVARAWISESPRLAWHPLPDRAIAALRSCAGPLYNRYDEGGYVIWFVPEQKVFLDSRQDPYPQTLITEHMQVEESGDYQPLFARYGIGCAFLPIDSHVTTRLAAAGWSVRYRDPKWIVFARPSST